MKVRCLYNSGEALRQYEYTLLGKEIICRFGTTGYSEYQELDIGRTYLVMGIIIFRNYQAYLIDDGRFISACPCQLFETVDDRISPNWHFRLVGKDEGIYPFIQAFLGYEELCSDEKAYENLIVEKDEDAQYLYFKRKREWENSDHQ